MSEGGGNGGMKGGMEGEPVGWCSYPRDCGLCIRRSRGCVWTCGCRSVTTWKHMVMSPPSGRQQNSLEQKTAATDNIKKACILQVLESKNANILEISYYYSALAEQ